MEAGSTCRLPFEVRRRRLIFRIPPKPAAPRYNTDRSLSALSNPASRAISVLRLRIDRQRSQARATRGRWSATGNASGFRPDRKERSLPAEMFFGQDPTAAPAKAGGRKDASDRWAITCRPIRWGPKPATSALLSSSFRREGSCKFRPRPPCGAARAAWSASPRLSPLHFLGELAAILMGSACYMLQNPLASKLPCNM